MGVSLREINCTSSTHALRLTSCNGRWRARVCDRERHAYRRCLVKCPTHVTMTHTCANVNVKGQLVKRTEWKQTDRRTRPIAVSCPRTRPVTILTLNSNPNNCYFYCPFGEYVRYSIFNGRKGGSVAEWLACWTQAQKGPGSNRSRDAVG